MNVNTQIWGDPSIWFHRSSAPNITTNCVLSEIRVGATSYDDDDFINYPATKFCRDICLFGYWRDGYLNPDGETPLDNSLSYVAIANPDLPQMDLRIATVGTQAGWANQALIQSNPQDVVPFSLATYRDYGGVYNPFGLSSSAYGIDGINYDASIYASQGFQRWCPFGRYDRGADIGNTRWGEYNPNGRLGMIGEFGLKSIILEIIVMRYDGGYYDIATQTLKSYANQSLEWRLAHPILSCYAIPHYRTHKNGIYTNGAPMGYTLDSQMIALSPVFYRSLHSNAINREYTTYLMGGHGQMSAGYFPIYGPVLSNNTYTSQWVGTNAQYENPTQTNMNFGAYFYGCQRGELRKNSIGSFQLVLQGTDENIEWLMRGAAAYGMFFCTEIGTLGNSGRDTGASERWLDPEMYCGVVTDTGLTFGDYTHGEDNADNTVYGWIDSTQTPYDPEYNPDPTHYDYETNLPTGNAVASDYYVSKRAGDLGDKIIIDNLIQSITDASEDPYDKNFLFQEPLKAVLDYRRILLKPINSREVGNAMYIPLGRFVSPSATPFTGWISPVRFRREYLGSYKFWRTYNNFMDFEPYTQAVIYVPYCGIKELPMNIFAGHEVKIYINADNVTGEIEALIFVDNIEWGTMHGMASEELPLIGETSMTAANTVRELDYQLSQNEFAKLTGIAGSLAGASISASFKNPMGVVTQGLGAGLKAASMTMQTMEIEYEIAHTKPEPLTIQKGSANIERMNVQYPFIMIQTPIIIKNDNETEEDVITRYGKIKGFKCCETGIIGNFHGLTKCSSAILDGISCTYTEKQMLLEALQEGVIL